MVSRTHSVVVFELVSRTLFAPIGRNPDAWDNRREVFARNFRKTNFAGSRSVFFSKVLRAFVSNVCESVCMFRGLEI